MQEFIFSFNYSTKLSILTLNSTWIAAPLPCQLIVSHPPSYGGVSVWGHLQCQDMGDSTIWDIQVTTEMLSSCLHFFISCSPEKKVQQNFQDHRKLDHSLRMQKYFYCCVAMWSTEISVKLSMTHDLETHAFISYLGFYAATLGLCPRRKQIFFDAYSTLWYFPSSYSPPFLSKHTYIYTLGNKNMIFLKMREYLKMVKI